MTDYGAGMLAMAMAVQARVEAMAAENKIREMRGESLAYDGDAFLSESCSLEMLARDLMSRPE